MSVFSSLNTAVGGLRAQSTALGHISDNIANSTTLGYKRTETNFRDLVTTSNQRLHSPGSVIAQPKFVNNVQGELTQSQTETHMAVSGNGYFVVSEPERFEGDEIFFRNEEFYTRRGDFELDRYGNMVNGAGYYLRGQPVIDQDTMNTSDVMEIVNVATTTTEPEATTRINYLANLPSEADVVPEIPAGALNAGVAPWSGVAEAPRAVGDVNVPGLASTDPREIDFTDVPVAEGAEYTVTIGGQQFTYTAAAGDDINDVVTGLAADIDADPAFDANGASAPVLEITDGAGTENISAESDAQTYDYDGFMASSVSGGALTVYDEIGNPYDVQMRWVRTDRNQWSLYYDRGDDPVDGRTWVEADQFNFANGQLVGDTSREISINLDSGFSDDINFSFANSNQEPGLTQYADSDISVFRLDQDGFRSGVMTNVFVDENGYVTASFDNGIDRTLYQVPVAMFNAENELNRKDGGAFFRSPESGTPRYEQMGRAGAGSINGSALENSNVDIADEFTKMIIAQRTYSANTRVITTSDEMLQEIINAKR
ncbi:flagellar hook-basal body complex protein [Fodinicurvata sp. EGI_FJ10296]|uniref:flagellar hook protein FlgE n=1 Tax=Fodinicurvata sp. EGI_FJ10296 TaxID=3231908 RepID=UPI0034549CEB